MATGQYMCFFQGKMPLTAMRHKHEIQDNAGKSGETI